MSFLLAAAKGVAAIPSLVDSVNSLVERLGSLEKAINEKQVQERMADKRARNSAAIKRVLARAAGPERGTPEPPSV